MTCCTLNSSCSLDWGKIHQQILQDPWLQKLTRDLEQGAPTPKWFTLERDILKYKGRVVLPRKSDITETFLKEYHDTPIGGHSGEYKTYQRIASDWPGMRKDIARYVAQCSIVSNKRLLP